MPVFYKIDKDRRIVLSTAAGVFSREDVAGHRENLLKDPDFDPTYSQLLDFTQVSKIEITPAEVRELAEANIFAPNSRRAILVSGDLAYSLARMFGALRELKGEPGVRVFRELDAALNWLLAKGESS